MNIWDFEPIYLNPIRRFYRKDFTDNGITFFDEENLYKSLTVRMPVIKDEKYYENLKKYSGYKPMEHKTLYAEYENRFTPYDDTPSYISDETVAPEVMLSNYHYMDKKIDYYMDVLYNKELTYEQKLEYQKPLEHLFNNTYMAYMYELDKDLKKYPQYKRTECCDYFKKFRNKEFNNFDFAKLNKEFTRPPAPTKFIDEYLDRHITYVEECLDSFTTPKAIALKDKIRYVHNMVLTDIGVLLKDLNQVISKYYDVYTNDTINEMNKMIKDTLMLYKNEDFVKALDVDIKNHINADKYEEVFNTTCKKYEREIQNVVTRKIEKTNNDYKLLQTNLLKIQKSISDRFTDLELEDYINEPKLNSALSVYKLLNYYLYEPFAKSIICECEHSYNTRTGTGIVAINTTDYNFIIKGELKTDFWTFMEEQGISKDIPKEIKKMEEMKKLGLKPNNFLHSMQEEITSMSYDIQNRNAIGVAPVNELPKITVYYSLAPETIIDFIKNTDKILLPAKYVQFDYPSAMYNSITVELEKPLRLTMDNFKELSIQEDTARKKPLLCNRLTRANIINEANRFIDYKELTNENREKQYSEKDIKTAYLLPTLLNKQEMLAEKRMREKGYFVVNFKTFGDTEMIKVREEVQDSYDPMIKR